MLFRSLFSFLMFYIVLLCIYQDGILLAIFYNVKFYDDHNLTSERKRYKQTTFFDSHSSKMNVSLCAYLNPLQRVAKINDDRLSI